MFSTSPLPFRKAPSSRGGGLAYGQHQFWMPGLFGGSHHCLHLDISEGPDGERGQREGFQRIGGGNGNHPHSCRLTRRNANGCIFKHETVLWSNPKPGGCFEVALWIGFPLRHILARHEDRRHWQSHRL